MADAMVQSLYMVVLMQEDLQQAIEFYERLGLQKLFYLPEKWAEFGVNGVRIGLCPAEHVEKGKHTGIVFQVQDMQETYEQLTAHGVEFSTAPITATHGLMASCYDPSGNKIDLYQPTHHKVKEVLDEAQKAERNGENKKESASGCCQKKDACC